MDYIPFRFSQKLIDELIKVWKDEHGIDISEDTANEYLNSFADLYLTFARIEERNKDNKDKKK
ncbi:MAG: hypothetical protein NT077_01425 [Candidatus Taylorbacteria bacterium]|nr:hypothetical protein [Candidatus Taylorbacteria bacterium]